MPSTAHASSSIINSPVLPARMEPNDRDTEIYGVPETAASGAHIRGMHNYLATWERSVDDTQAFWAAEAKARIEWIVPPRRVMRGSFEDGDISWFDDGLLNVSVNCLDRHPPQNTAIIWEGDEVGDSRRITYGEALASTCQIANALRSLGVRKGDRVCIYMPMVPEAAFAMLACARIGAVHSVVFAGFSAEVRCRQPCCPTL